MANGFEVYDDLGRTQASDKAYDLSISAEYVITSRTLINKDMLALESAPDERIFLGFYRETGEEGISNIVKGKGKAHVFEYGQVLSANLGLEVYDEVGKLTFSSNLKSCNVIDFVSIPNIFNSDAGGGLTFSKYYGGKRVAVIPIKLPYFAVRNPQNSVINMLATMGFDTTGGYVRVGRSVDEENFLPSSMQFQYPTELVFMVIDVTNY